MTVNECNDKNIISTRTDVLISLTCKGLLETQLRVGLAEHVRLVLQKARHPQTDAHLLLQAHKTSIHRHQHGHPGYNNTGIAQWLERRTRD